MAQITYTDKNTGDQVTASDMNMIKGVVNENFTSPPSPPIATGSVIGGIVSSSQLTIDPSTGIATPKPPIANVPNLATQLNKKKPLKIIGRNHGQDSVLLNAGTDYNFSSRAIYTVKGGVSVVKAFFGKRQTTFAPEIIRATLENAFVVVPLNKGGAQDFISPSTLTGPGVWTDDCGFNVYPGGQFYVREFKRVSKFPTSPAASLVTGGTLPTSSVFYKFTTVDNGIESGPSAEVTVSPTGGTLSAGLSWTPAAYGQYTNIYRGTATGAERFLTQVPIQQSSYVDTGALTVNAAVSPPTQGAVCCQHYLRQTGDQSNPQYAGGDPGDNQTGAIGNFTGSHASGPVGVYMSSPICMVGDDYDNISILGLGDSILWGSGVNGLIGVWGNSLGCWFDRGFTDGQFGGTLNMGAPSSQIIQTLTAQTPGDAMLQMIQYADYVLCEWGINDLSANATWQNIALAHINLARQAVDMGCRYINTTLLPLSFSSDSFITATNQFITGAPREAGRINYNNWVRGGWQVDGSGNPVLSGGTSSPYFYAYFDACAVVEVNSSNVPTVNGGFWLAANTTADYTGQVLTGTPTLTALAISAAAYPVLNGTQPGLVNKVIKMTSGAAIGQTASISANTATGITLVANGAVSSAGVVITGLTVTPAAGDTFSIYTPVTVDGTHPSQTGYADIGSSWATAVNTLIVKFGSMVGS